MGGTSISWRRLARVRPVLLSGGWNDGFAGSVLGTLLGPEGVAAVTNSGDLMVGRTALCCCGCLRVLVVGPGRRRAAVRDLPFLENCIVDASIFIFVHQVDKGTRWMPWHQEPMKDVGTCDKPRVVGNRTVIRGFPNGATRLESCPVTHA
jgi:hypothetical protein